MPRSNVPFNGVLVGASLKRAAHGLFGSPGNAALTLASLALLALVLPQILHWALLNAQFTGDAAQCRAPGRTGACWAFVTEKFRFFLIGFYPTQEAWRPLAAIAVFVSILAVAGVRSFLGWPLLIAWTASMIAIVLLLHGGLPGLPAVPMRQWSGLTLTVALAGVGVTIAYPLAIMLALGRRSTLPVVRYLCVGVIEAVRGVPLVTVLFMASIMMPLFLPEGATPDKVLRALFAFALFAASYLAEIVRGGLQTIPRSQYEAASALGLGYWPTMASVILPQALRNCLPPTVSQVIAMFKDTSLVVIVGVTDFFGAVRVALNDPAWLGFYVEGYLFAAFVYLTICTMLSILGGRMERNLEIQGRA